MSMMERLIKRRGRKARERVRFFVTSRGDVCKGTGDSLPAEAVAWMQEAGVANRCHHAVVAMARGKLIGFVRWDHWNEEVKPHLRSEALRGTYVVKGWRGVGIGTSLWEMALGEFDPKLPIEVTTTSKGGKALVNSFRRVHPGLKWEHDPFEDGLDI